MSFSGTHAANQQNRDISAFRFLKTNREPVNAQSPIRSIPVPRIKDWLKLLPTGAGNRSVLNEKQNKNLTVSSLMWNNFFYFCPSNVSRVFLGQQKLSKLCLLDSIAHVFLFAA